MMVLCHAARLADGSLPPQRMWRRMRQDSCKLPPRRMSAAPRCKPVMLEVLQTCDVGCSCKPVMLEVLHTCDAGVHHVLRCTLERCLQAGAAARCSAARSAPIAMCAIASSSRPNSTAPAWTPGALVSLPQWSDAALPPQTRAAAAQTCSSPSLAQRAGTHCRLEAQHSRAQGREQLRPSRRRTMRPVEQHS